MLLSVVVLLEVVLSFYLGELDPGSWLDLLPPGRCADPPGLRVSRASPLVHGQLLAWSNFLTIRMQRHMNSRAPQKPQECVSLLGNVSG